VDAFIQLRSRADAPLCRLRASGWLGSNQQAFFDEQVKKVQAVGLGSDFDYVDSPTHADKVRFLRSVDVLSVPTIYREPKGLYILEAWANGIPVVQPRHGTFPELIEQSGGGLLVDSPQPQVLASGLHEMLSNDDLRARSGRAGEVAVRERFTATAMARRIASILEEACFKLTP
jgi:glycosyltransferase involved in cell wall biosynthesis